ncbi:NAD(P)H-hydrate dehydratase [Horticoccus luteus]|uniref:ADP-dependent (S)-NAD(P)H-hydrate dehydratase n=1 Tax=Horticoccus luteus TaxID=2862869 RepID=A0A8F9TTT2_9BACT|nr:NAD(P)H-hydrate dehydratase [Horticoccus luteus]QYM77990.1 NAD(P)H-hydrate dehydratase [Horticoccus luteus]
MTLPASHPILTCAEAKALEARVLGGDEAAEWRAMSAAGAAIATAMREDMREAGGFPAGGRLLVLVGKGHNGGDALIAARVWRTFFPAARVDVWFAFGERALRPLTARAWRELATVDAERVRVVSAEEWGARYDASVDGVFGFQFRPPVDEATKALLLRFNELDVRFRAAVDLPSADVARADFTYATGSVKTPVVDAEMAGRVRYLDLGFFRDDVVKDEGERALRREILAPLARLRPARGDKRNYGQLIIVAGSRSYPGAALLATLGALQSGVGMLTVLVPETCAAAFAARAPDAMWVGCPVTPEGGLALDTLSVLRERMGRATALMVGPGLGREKETLAMIAEAVKLVDMPVAIDADALQPEIVAAVKGAKVLTPHAGEFARIAGKGADLRAYAQAANATVVLKGPVTRVSSGGGVYQSFFGGPVLARGGSGDVLSGLCGGLLAQTPDDPLLAATRATVWHGVAADALARMVGHTAARTADLPGRLSEILRRFA